MADVIGIKSLIAPGTRDEVIEAITDAIKKQLQETFSADKKLEDNIIIVQNDSTHH